MITVTVHTAIGAPLERCFDLARSVDLHLRSTDATRERAVGGVTRGLMGLGDEVTWEAVHLGLRQKLTARITQFDRPHHFRDSQVRGAFRRFDHDHFFRPTADGTDMQDVFTFSAPLGPLGWLVERAFLAGYLRRFLVARAAVIRQVAEGEEWRNYLRSD